nr:hypothetical protein [Tanacetum cinerariifolium]
MRSLETRSKNTLGGRGDELFWEGGDDFGVDILRLHTCLTDILGFLEKLEWWFEQDIDKEEEIFDGDEDGGEPFPYECTIFQDLPLCLVRGDIRDFKEYLVRDYYCWLKTYCCCYNLKLLDDTTDIKLRLLEQSAGGGIDMHYHLMRIMRIEQYFLMTDYSLWEVILNGDSPIPTRVIDGVVQPVAPTTAEQRLARKNELEARVSAVASVSAASAKVPVSALPNVDTLSDD